MSKTFEGWLIRAAAVLAAGMPLAPVGTQAAPRGVDVVSVAAVNYSGREMNGVLFIDPEHKDKVAGGPPLLPYGGSGEMCCYELPHKWRPGLKVKVRYDWWEGDVPRNYRFLTVELPPYTTDGPGTLWALFHDDETVEVFASAVDPGHPKWPGKVKHWPVPSREYKLKLWQIEYDQFASTLPYARKMKEGLSEEELKEAWEHSSQYSPKTLKTFTGPADPRFAAFMKSEGERDLALFLERLRQLDEVKP